MSKNHGMKKFIPHNLRVAKSNKKWCCSTRIFTVLAIIFFIIMLVVLVIAIYLSTGGGSSTNSKQNFTMQAILVVPFPLLQQR